MAIKIRTVGIMCLVLSVACVAPVVRTFLSLYTGDGVIITVIMTISEKLVFVIAGTVFFAAGFSALLMTFVQSMAANRIRQEPTTPPTLRR